MTASNSYGSTLCGALYMEPSKLKTIFILGVLIVSIAFLGLAWYLHETAVGSDPIGTIAFYILIAVGSICFIFGGVIFLIRHDIDL